VTETTFHILIALLAILVAAGLLVRARLRVPSRRYEGPASVSGVYDQWTTAGLVEFYWGEHLHAGHYGNPPIKKDFITAKVDMVEEVIKWGIAPNSKMIERLEQPGNASGAGLVRVLDVGCGIGGCTRHLAKRWPKTAHVTGITISKAQVERATALAHAQGVENAVFLECDALDMAFPDASFDVVWAVESEPHIPDKERLVSEMVRVLRPGGTLVIAAWNVRDTRHAPLSKKEIEHVQLLLDEWCHAKFISIREYVELFEKNDLIAIVADDWAVPTLPSWREAVLVSVRNPLGLIKVSMGQRWALARDAYTMLRFGAAFRNGLCEYGLIRGQKAG
jgi:MPBQ/MSBQ methyltransferase